MLPFNIPPYIFINEWRAVRAPQDIRRTLLCGSAPPPIILVVLDIGVARGESSARTSPTQAILFHCFPLCFVAVVFPNSDHQGTGPPSAEVVRTYVVAHVALEALARANPPAGNTAVAG